MGRHPEISGPQARIIIITTTTIITITYFFLGGGGGGVGFGGSWLWLQMGRASGFRMRICVRPLLDLALTCPWVRLLQLELELLHLLLGTHGESTEGCHFVTAFCYLVCL